VAGADRVAPHVRQDRELTLERVLVDTVELDVLAVEKEPVIGDRVMFASQRVTSLVTGRVYSSFTAGEQYKITPALIRSRSLLS
jgi:hypothetical protein